MKKFWAFLLISFCCCFLISVFKYEIFTHRILFVGYNFLHLEVAILTHFEFLFFILICTNDSSFFYSNVNI